MPSAWLRVEQDFAVNLIAIGAYASRARTQFNTNPANGNLRGFSRTKTQKNRCSLATAAVSYLAEWTGLEPATPGVTGRYSNQLNYHSWQAAFACILHASQALQLGDPTGIRTPVLTVKG